MRILRMGLAGLLSVACAGAGADDTDIYLSTVAPPSAVPLVMVSIDTSAAAGAVYAGCSQVGSGSGMCAAAQYFRDNCATCVLPAADQPLTYFHVMRYALRMTLMNFTGMKVGLMLSHDHDGDCKGPRPLSLTSSTRCSNGGYIARGFKVLDTTLVPGTLGLPDTTVPGPNTTELLTILDSLPVPQGSVAHAYQGKELFFEMFRYLTGQAIYNGHNGYEDYGTDNLANLDVDRPAIDWDPTIESLGSYVSPLTADLACAKIFTLNFVLNGSSQDDDSDNAIDSDSAGGMIGLNLSGRHDEFEDVIAYLYDVDLARASAPFGTVPALNGKQNVTSYFFSRPTPLDSRPATFDRTTTEYAKEGGTVHPLPFAGDPSKVVDQIRSTLGQILSVSTTFVSGSVPVNVFSRTQVLSDVYLALFKPDAAAKPFWVGNVKKLQAKVFQIPCAVGATDCTPGKEVRLVDSLAATAIDDDGRIRNEALTFWTDGSRIAADSVKGVIAGRDGRHVDRGGAGQKIAGYLSGSPGMLNADTGARQIYLYPGTGSSLVALNADASMSVSLQQPLGAADAAESLRLLKFIRGFDEYDHDSDLSKTEVRPWLMADPLHSRPLPINYGAFGGHTRDNPAIFIAVATNDGLLHFIRNTTTSGTQSGAEQWAFLPVDLLSVQKALAVNTPVSKRLYGFDGAPTAYVMDLDGDGTVEPADGDKVYLYVGMRRGGRAYYALDVTDPAAPRFLWRVGPTVSAGLSASLACQASISAGTALSGASACAAELNNLLCSGDFCEMGYTFSQPRLGRVQTGVDAGGAAVIRPVVVFGGGYDALLNDYSAATLSLYKLGLASPGSVNTDDLLGNAIYVVDAETGALVWKVAGPSLLSGLPPLGGNAVTHLSLRDSVPSTLTIVDTNNDGLSDRIVAGDTGGNVWRADLAGAPSGWTLTRLASLGRHAGVGKVNDRRFFHEPDFVLSQDENGAFDAVILGSGDREDPLDYGRERSLTGAETFPENGFYVIKDRNTAIGSASDLLSTSVLTPSSLADLTDNCLQSGVTSSCNPDLRNGWRIQLRQGRGEKVLAAPLTAAHRIYFTSYLPPGSNEAATCGPAEGSGLFYALGLKKARAVFNFNTADGGTTDSPNSAADRFDALASPGIPTEVVYINLPDANGAEVKCGLGSDLNCRALPGATRFRTFWYREE